MDKKELENRAKTIADLIAIEMANKVSKRFFESDLWKEANNTITEPKNTQQEIK